MKNKTKKTRRTIRDLELENAALKGRVEALEAVVQKLVAAPAQVQYVPTWQPHIIPYLGPYRVAPPYVPYVDPVPYPWTWCELNPCDANPMPFRHVTSGFIEGVGGVDAGLVFRNDGWPLPQPVTSVQTITGYPGPNVTGAAPNWDVNTTTLVGNVGSSNLSFS